MDYSDIYRDFQLEEVEDYLAQGRVEREKDDAEQKQEVKRSEQKEHKERSVVGVGSSK